MRPPMARRRFDDERGVSVLTLQTDRDGWFQRRDPRVKWLMFFSLLVLIYVAPSWPWMAAATLAGLAITIAARPPLLWLGFALFVQTPNILGLIFLPLLGGGEVDEEIAFGLRLGLGWVAAIFFGIGLLSTMAIPQLVAGLRGLGLPRRFAALIGQVFVMIYLSFTDLARLSRRARVEFGSFFSHPVWVVDNLTHLFVPSIVSVTKRSAVMAIALDVRGGGRGLEPYFPRPMTMGDFALLAATMLALAGAVAARFGVI